MILPHSGVAKKKLVAVIYCFQHSVLRASNLLGAHVTESILDGVRLGQKLRGTVYLTITGLCIKQKMKLLTRW